MATVSRIDCKSQNIYSTETPQNNSVWTGTKVKRVALYLFAALLISAGIAACFLLPPLFNLLPIATLIPAIGVSYKAAQIKDYENPAELKKYQAQAKKMTFRKVYTEFGLQATLEHQLLTLDELKGKFDRQVKEMDFSSVIRKFDLDELAAHSIASVEHIALLKHLKEQEALFRAQYKQNYSRSSRREFHRQLQKLDNEYTEFKRSYMSLATHKGVAETK